LWIFDDDLFIIEDYYDENKTSEEYEFAIFLIWVRIFNIPLGRTNRDTGEAMGNVIGQYITVEVGEAGMAEGQYLRVKVRMQVANH
jgi:hypothetical protein